MQIADQVLEDFGFRCRWLMRFWRVPVQIEADEVPKGSGPDSQKPSKIFKLLGITHEFF